MPPDQLSAAATLCGALATGLYAIVSWAEHKLMKGQSAKTI